MSVYLYSAYCGREREREYLLYHVSLVCLVHEIMMCVHSCIRGSSWHGFGAITAAANTECYTERAVRT